MIDVRWVADPAVEWLTPESPGHRFAIPESEAAYLFTRPDGRVTRPPATSDIELEPGCAYHLDAEVALEGVARGILYLLEFRGEERVATHQAKLAAGWNRLGWTTHASAERWALALRLSGTGVIAIRQLQLFEQAAPDPFSEIVRLGKAGKTLVFIAGCARSGTTLMLNMMRCCRQAFCDDTERPIVDFPVVRAGQPVIVLKRTATCWKTLSALPPEVALIYMVRHPFDVLTSKWGKQSSYYVTPERWIAEYDALEALQLSQPDRALEVVRYEDLVRDPDRVQRRLGDSLELTFTTPFSQFHTLRPLRDVGRDRLPGLLTFDLRAPSTSSLDRWKRDGAARRHLRDVLSAADRERVAEFLTRFDYDRDDINRA